MKIINHISAKSPKVGQSSVTESHLREFVRAWQHVALRAVFAPARTALFTARSYPTRYGLEWRTVKRRRCMRATDYGSAWRGPWRDMLAAETPGSLYADIAARIEELTDKAVLQGVDPTTI
jgi:hypothetical protein